MPIGKGFCISVNFREAADFFSFSLMYSVSALALGKVHAETVGAQSLRFGDWKKLVRGNWAMWRSVGLSMRLASQHRNHDLSVDFTGKSLSG